LRLGHPCCASYTSFRTGPTTNAIESLNFQLRKVLRPKGHFPTDDAVLKVVYLAIKHASFRWKPSKDWPKALTHFAIVFGDRLPV
jgi:putative transposase